MQRGHRRALAHKGAKLGHFGQNHGHDLDRVDLFLGKQPGLFRLHHQDAQLFAKSLDQHAEERRIRLFAGFRHEAKARRGGGIIGVDHRAGARDTAHQPLAKAHAGLVNGLGLEPLGRAEFQRVLVPEEIDGTHLGMHFLGDEPGDLVQPRLTAGILCHHRAQAAQHLAAVGLEGVGHR